MALSSPYDTLVDLIRSEVGDLLPPPDQIFTDDDIIREINAATVTRVNTDWGIRFLVINDSLDPAVISDKVFMTAIIIRAAIRLLNIRKQIGVRQNIAISKGTTRISVDPLVKSFNKAIEILEQRYNDLKITGFNGIVHSVASVY